MQKEKRSFWGTGQGDHHVATLHHCCTDRHKNTNLAKAIRQDSGSRDNAARPGQDAQTTARTARRAGQGARPTTQGAWHFWPPEVRPRPKATGNSAKSTEHLVHLCISSKSLVSIQTGHLDFEVWRSEERGLLVVLISMSTALFAMVKTAAQHFICRNRTSWREQQNHDFRDG